MALNPEQFGPFANTGPIHARLAYETEGGHYRGQDRVTSQLRKQVEVPVPEHVHEDQGQFFDPNRIARPEPHQQTPAQFAADPRSWWHGRYQKGPRLTKGGSNEGFHAGTLASATKRLEANYGRRSGETPARLFPTRLVGKMGPQEQAPSTNSLFRGGGPEPTRGSSPEEPGFDRQRHSGLAYRSRGYFYKNEVEDPGHISVGVPKREGFLATHRELVEHAQSEGKFVHPNIAWAAKKMPQHTGVDAMAYKRRRPGDESRQMNLAQSIQGTPAEGEVRARMFAEERGTQRHSYTTESGQTHHVVKRPGGDWWHP